MGCCYCCCLLCWLEETYSHIVGCQAPRLKKRSQNFQESRPPLSPSHIRAAGHFRGQFVRKKRWLEKPRAVLVASNLTNSDARPHNPPWATHSQSFLPLPGNHLRGRKKIVEESDDSRITTTRTFVCHLHSISSFSDFYILKSVYGMPLSRLYTGTHTSQMFVLISLSTLSIEIAIVHMTLHLEWRRWVWLWPP